jgi:hypothetical protein
MHQTDFLYKNKELPISLKNYGIIFFIVGLALALVAFIVDKERAIFNYLVLYSMLISIGLGSLFLIALEYVAGADWSVPFRRIPEFLSGILPLLFILVIPLLIFNHDLFHWTHKEIVEQDEILKGKEPYLNITFFIIRVIAFIFIWVIFFLVLRKNSLSQDYSKDQNLTRKNIIISAIFIPTFAITITFTAIDWLMSLEPHWFSTIFGVYYFSGTVICAIASVTLIVVYLKEKGYYNPWITNDHLYSFGALLFAFVNFWAYIAFSQFMLIWYANLPEETFWFLTRWEGSWKVISILLIIVHFVVPYSVLLSQPSKMNPNRLKFISIWLIFAHLLDLFWLIMPNMNELKKGYNFSWIDFVFPVLGIGLVLIVFNFFSKNKNLIPVGDPKLNKGLNFHL